MIKTLTGTAIGLLCTLITHRASAQLPDKDSLWQRLNYLTLTTSIPERQKLTELLRYDSVWQFRSGPRDSTLSLLKQRIGACYFNTGDYASAVTYYRQAIDIAEHFPGNLASPDLKIKNYYLLHWASEYLDDIATRIRAADSCIAYAVRFDRRNIFLLRALHFRMSNTYDAGDFRRSLDFGEILERSARKLAQDAEKSKDTITPKFAWEFSAIAILKQANAFFRLKNYDAADRILRTNLPELLHPRLPKSYPGTVYQDYFEFSIAKKEYREALNNLQQALKYEQIAGDTVACKLILANIGYQIYFLHYKDAKKALEYCRRGLLYKKMSKGEEEDEKMETLSVYNYIANIYRGSRQFDSAYYYYQLAFDIVFHGMSEHNIRGLALNEMANMPKAHYLAELLLDKGNAYLMEHTVTKQQNVAEKAINLFRMTDLFLSQVKTLHSDIESKLMWRSNFRRLYESAIDACKRINDFETAFYFFEKGRSVLLNEQLVEQRWFSDSDISALAQLRKKVQLLEIEMEAGDQKTDRYDALRKELFSVKQQLDRLHKSVMKKDPLYYHYFMDTTVITLKQVRRELLRDHDAFLEIFRGADLVYLLTVTRDKITLKEISKMRFDSLSATYLSYLVDFEKMNQGFPEFRNISHDLFYLLFGDGSLYGSRIIVSPDGEGFPFESLITNKAGSPRYFIQDYAVSYTYSARYLVNYFSDRKYSGSTMMGVAPIVYPANSKLSSLPGSDQSLQLIASFFKQPHLLRGSEANKANFLSRFHQYRIIQLYTHADETSEREEPVIFFADSSLYLSDLVGERKPLTSLVVLSACETGRGKHYQGEGIFSFNRGFAAMGIPAAVTSMWTVDSKATYKLTESFYKFLADGHPTDIALQKAKLELIQSPEMSLPYYWAAPVLTGKTEIIFHDDTLVWLWIAIGVLIAALLIWLLLRRKILSRP